MAGVNQLERDLLKMRQREGIDLAKQRGGLKNAVIKTLNGACFRAACQS